MSSRLPASDSEPWRRLAAAVLLQAARDAVAESGTERKASGVSTEAQEWLRSPEAQALAAALDLDNSLRRWLRLREC